MTAPTEPVDLDEHERIDAAMTPGPWMVAGPFPTVTIYRDTPEDHPAEQIATIGEFHPDDLKNCADEPDARGIVYIRNDHAALVAELRAARERVKELEAQRDGLVNGTVRTFRSRAADTLADEVAVLVRRKVIDSRSPAADALLSFRNPPNTERADRMASLEARNRALVAGLEEACRSIHFESCPAGPVECPECMGYVDSVNDTTSTVQIERLRTLTTQPEGERGEDVRALIEAYGQAVAAHALQEECGSTRSTEAAAVVLAAAKEALLAALGIAPEGG